ncbi:hypothetical protein D187_000694 [Cystobacter fuscus DSM 2262]|uniref:Uncharacterized protein n=1 Tax=Cystobacter fuscus (strain ATCC 25194 / DSM 2262 / NBRC 100088 / M29) TaxID=1242864 RepID=S9QV95_CYSF2|nr:hypothetical protein [Cystobacter fuscus]EPX65269.1 hypothetical protein D187_000694 [Cystobacter fuscus DSM 2262]
MSNKSKVEVESRVVHGAHGVSSEEDHIDTGKVIQVGVGSIIIFIVGGIWAWRLQVATTHEFVPEGAAPIPALITPDKDHRTAYEIGIVNQRLFQQDTHAEEKIRSQQEALDKGYAEDRNVVSRTPLNQAMDQVIAQQAAARQQPAAPAPTPEPQPTPAPQP